MSKIKLNLISLIIIMMLGVVGVQGMDNNRLYPARENTTYTSKYGYINQKGEWIVSPTYDYAYPFSDGYGVVGKGDLYGAINDVGAEVIPLKYANLRPFQSQRAVFSGENGWGVIDTKGQVITDENYAFIQDYAEDRAVVAKTVGEQLLYGYIDLDGQEVIPAQYLSADSFQKDRALVKLKENQYALIDQEGQVEHSYDYPIVYGYSEGFLVYGDQVGGKMGYLTEAGEVSISPQYEMASPFKEGAAVVGESLGYESKQGLINVKGEEIYPVIYNDIKSLGEERVALGKSIDETAPYKGSIYAIGDLKGNILTDFMFHDIAPYQGGIASVYDETDTYFVNKEGQVISDFPKVSGAGTLTEEGPVVAGNIDYITFYYNDQGILVYTPSKDVELGQGRVLEAVKYDPNINYVVYYGQLKGLDDQTVQEGINQQLEAEAKKDGIMPTDELEYSFYSNFTVPFSQKQLVVIDTMDSIYYFGAAHPNSERRVDMIDLGTGAFYDLEDLFKKDTEWKAQLESIIQQQAKEKPYKDILYVAPESLIVDETQGFFVDQENLYIFYEPYEIGPYAAGYITFKIPYTQIKENIDSESSFWKSFN